MTTCKVGIDVGGTFTDLTAVDMSSGQVVASSKVPSTPTNFVDGFMNVLEKCGLLPSEVEMIVHGTTIGTNSIIERRGAKTILITTHGFRDVLTAQRSGREEIYDLDWEPQQPAIRRRDIYTVSERMDYRGNELTPLDEAGVKRIADFAKELGTESIGICFINSFVNPAHEIRAREILQEELPGVLICISYDLAPVMKEYERTNSTVINAILMPIMTKYMDGLLSRLKTEDYKCEPLIIHSGGGVMTVDATRLLPARTCISGPAAGVMGGLLYGKAAGFENVITLDMGGTSTDVSLCPKGEMGIVSEWHLAYDVPVLIPAVDLLSIGAGGGSIAWVDETGRLRSGPRSAGAYPGPICYDTGGGEPTTTDAQLVLQRINPRNFCGGELAVKEELSYQGIKEKIAEPLGMKSVEEAAEGIVRIAVGNMVNAVRIVSVERGYDPTDFSMVAFGGGGASCAVEIARGAMIPKVVIPPIASVVGAWGALVAQLRHDFVRSFSKIAGETNTEEINRAFDELDRMAIEALRKDDVADDNITLEHYADLKYYDQSVALTLDMPQKMTDIEKEIVSAYVTRQEREFGYSMPADYTQVELVNLRVSGWGKIPLAKIAEVITETGTAEEAQIGSRDVFFDRGFMKTRIYDRPKLKLEAEVEGPAILEEATTTTVIPPGAAAVTDKYGNIIITV